MQKETQRPKLAAAAVCSTYRAPAKSSRWRQLTIQITHTGQLAVDAQSKSICTAATRPWSAITKFRRSRCSVATMHEIMRFASRVASSVLKLRHDWLNSRSDADRIACPADRAMANHVCKVLESFAEFSCRICWQQVRLEALRRHLKTRKTRSQDKLGERELLRRANGMES